MGNIYILPTGSLSDVLVDSGNGFHPRPFSSLFFPIPNEKTLLRITYSIVIQTSDYILQ